MEELTSAAGASGRDPKRIGDLFARADVNKDGEIDASEHEAMLERLAERHTTVTARGHMPSALHAFFPSEDEESNVLDRVG
jgi:hypothetical protein